MTAPARSERSESTNEAPSSLRQVAEAARRASRDLAILPRPAKDGVILRVAELLEQERDAIMAANATDVERAREAGLEPYYIDRLIPRLDAIAADARNVATLDDPVGEVFDARVLANGMQIGRRRVPLGVIACIYESRPNVTIDVSMLCLKSGNASILRGGKEALNTNVALGRIVQQALAEHDVNPDAVQVVDDPDRALIDELLTMNDLIDLVIPRGGAALVNRVRDNARMAVVAGGIGVVHAYVHEDADPEMALEIVDNSKRRRYSICNALDTLLVDEAIAPAFLPALGERWAGAVTVLGDDRARATLAEAAVAGLEVEPVREEDWDTEHLALRCGVRVVASMDEALDHIREHGSGHTEAIVTDDYAAAMRFMDEVDSAAVFVNASTQFTDGGQFGLGAEVAISTGKAHARGPIGLRELTSYKWTVFGSGQVRPA